jgi:hypothetical protein
MRSPDLSMILAMSMRAKTGDSGVEAEVGGNVFTVWGWSGDRVMAVCPLPDGTRFRLEARTGDNRQDSEFRIELLGSVPEQYTLLCDVPKPALMSAPWGWRDTLSLDHQSASAPSFRQMAEDAITAIGLASPRMCDPSRMDGLLSAMIDRYGFGMYKDTHGGDTGGCAYADVAKLTNRRRARLARGRIGQSDAPRESVVPEAARSMVRAAASSFSALPSSAARLSSWNISDDADDRDSVRACSGAMSRTVAADGLRPSKAVGTAPDLCRKAPPVGAYLVYSLGSRVFLAIGDPAGPRSAIREAALYVWKSRCVLLFGGQVARFDNLSQIADPDLRDLAGLLLLAREIAVRNIADAPYLEQRAAAAAADTARQAAERTVRQALIPSRAAASLIAGDGEACARPAGDDVGRGADDPAARDDASVALVAPPYVRGAQAAPAARGESGWLLGNGAALSVAVACVAVSAGLAAVAPVVFLPLPFAAAAVSAAFGGARVVADRRSRPSRAAVAEASGDDPLAALDAAVLHARGRIPAAVAEHLRRLRGDIEACISLTGTAGAGDQDAYIVREAALRYVPEAIDGYLALPAGSPSTHEGRTPEQELDYQIGLIEARIRQVLDGGARDLVGDFEAHGRFLRERLATAPGAPVIPAAPSPPAVAERASAMREMARG